MTIPTVNLMTGKAGRYGLGIVKAFPQLDPIAEGTTIVRGGNASLSDGVEHVFTSAGGATITGDPLIIRGGGA